MCIRDRPCYGRLSVRQGDKPRADGTYPDFSNCEDVLGPDEARAIMAAQDRAAAGRGGRDAPRLDTLSVLFDGAAEVIGRPSPSR